MNPDPILKGKTVFNLADFGAAGDGIADATPALRDALEACHRDGNGVVVVPEGTFSIKPVYLKSRVHLHLLKGATLLGSGDPADYADWESERIRLFYAAYNARALFFAVDEENITLSGEGTIDGHGRAFYDCPDPSASWFPIRDIKTRPGRTFLFALCRSVAIHTLTFRDSPAWTFWMFGCEAVRFQGIAIRNNPKALNTDGIDIDACRNVVISHCDITTGDDAIALRNIWRVFHQECPEPSRTGLGFGMRPCEQITVENCSLRSRCNGILIGYLRDDVIRNIVIRNVSILDSYRGIISLIPIARQTLNARTDGPAGDGPVIENIHVCNVTVEAAEPLWWFVSDEATLRRIGNLTLENVTLRGRSHSVIKGNQAVPVCGVLLRNVTFERTAGEKVPPFHGQLLESAAHLHLSNVRGISLQNVHFTGDNPACEADAPAIRLDRVNGLELGHFTNATRFPLMSRPA